VTSSAPPREEADTTRDAGSSRARLIAARAALGIAAVIVIYLAFVETTVGQRFDDAAKLYAVTKQIHYRRYETLASFGIVVSVVMVVAAHAAWARRGVLSFAWTAFAVLPPWLLAELGKQTLPRHHLHPTPPWIGSASFPSGHVSITAGCLLTMVLLAPWAARRWVTLLATFTLMASVTLVITSGMHRPSDVFAAPLLALAWAGCIAAWTMPARHRWSRASHAALVGAATLAVIGGAIGSVSFHSEPSGVQNLPAQTVINHTLYGAVIVALAIVVAVGIAAYEMLAPVTLAWADQSPTSSDSGRTSAV
jgi:membrane-associated phospholipid phosphatase